MNYAAGAVADAEIESGPTSGSLIALIQTARTVQEELERALDTVGLSPAKYQALDALVRAGQPLALSELAGCLNCVRSNITQLADRLEADGLVRRVDDASDRRAIRAVVTPLGVGRHEAATQVLRDLQVAFSSRMSPADEQALVRVLATLRQ